MASDPLHGLIQYAEKTASAARYKVIPTSDPMYRHGVSHDVGCGDWRTLAKFALRSDAEEFIAAKLPLVMGEWA